MALVVQQLINRLKDKATGNFTTTIAQNHIQLVQSQMEAHFRSRQEADKIAVIYFNEALTQIALNHDVQSLNSLKKYIHAYT